MNDDNSRQKIIDNIKSVDTVLVTVSTNPSVDELAAALGLSLFINDLDKRSTAVVSGDLPPAINFLEPEKTFENSVDSLRDFVIALDKEKADHLRYKVDGDVVKIFITPYKTIISSDDLEYSQGDYNVEMVIAVGVKDKEHLDKALVSHGRILHDAIVATIGVEASQLGSVDYSDSKASSMSELVANIVTSVSDDKTKISEQVASALLTGIVAATDRFSNSRTSSEVMSVAAKLMSSGANQQLIASKLREGSKTPMVDNQVSEKIQKESGDKPSKRRRSKNRGLSVNHSTKSDNQPKKQQNTDTAADALGEVLADPKETTSPAASDKSGNNNETSTPAEQLLDSALGESTGASNAGAATDVVPNLAEELAKEASSEAAGSDSGKDNLNNSVVEGTEQKIGASQSPASKEDQPSFGGVLNATTEQAAEDKRTLEKADRNRTILTRGQASDKEIEGLGSSPINGSGTSEEQKMFNPMQEPEKETPEPVLPPVSTQNSQTPPEQTLADLDRENRQVPQQGNTPEPVADITPPPADGVKDASALDAVHAAFDASPPPTPEPITTPAIEAIRDNQEQTTGPSPAPVASPPSSPPPPQPPVDLSGGIPTPPPPPPPSAPTPQDASMPDFSQLPTPPVLPGSPQEPAAPMQPAVPVPPTLPPENLESIMPTQDNLPPQTPPSNDPGEFKIPGQ